MLVAILVLLCINLFFVGLILNMVLGFKNLLGDYIFLMNMRHMETQNGTQTGEELYRYAEGNSKPN